MPVIMVFEGWRHSRRSEIVGKMMQYMDARGFRVFTSTRITEHPRIPGFHFHKNYGAGEATAFLYHVLASPSASGEYLCLPSRLVLSEK